MLRGKRNGKAYEPLDPSQDPSSIGNLAIRKGYATRQQVIAAAQKQEERQPLGQILIEAGVLTSVQLEELLIEQEIERRHMNERQESKLIRKKKREKLSEVTRGLHDVAASLQLAAKS